MIRLLWVKIVDLSGYFETLATVGSSERCVGGNFQEMAHYYYSGILSPDSYLEPPNLGGFGLKLSNRNPWPNDFISPFC